MIVTAKPFGSRLRAEKPKNVGKVLSPELHKARRKLRRLLAPDGASIEKLREAMR